MNVPAPKHLSFVILSGLLWMMYIPTAAALTQNEVQKLLASDGAANDHFGFSVSVDGDTAVIGARGDDDAGCCNSRSGSAYVFIRNGSTWTEQAKLTASDAAAGDEFGHWVSVDGDTAVIGAYRDDDAGSQSGSAYVFTRIGSTWTEQAKLTANDAAEGDFFGFSVSVDGDTAVIGAFADDDAGTSSGSAYVFTRNGSTWTEQAKLTASDAAADDLFGGEVSVNGDTAVITAVSDDDAGSQSGSAYVFTRIGSTWTEQAKLTASDAAADDFFGDSVSVDGDTAVIGALGNDDAGTRSGSAYVFIHNGSTWTEQAKLTASDAAASDEFGHSVSIDGETAVIGAWHDDDAGTRSGSAYVFIRNGSTWTEQAKLTASDAAATDEFGYSVSVDGDTAFIGAIENNKPGSAYVFTLTGPDTDDDGVPDADDNCPNDLNYDQADFDEDSIGDVCDDDSDGDGVAGLDDQCLWTELDAITDATGCSIAQLCPADGNWKNHGAYVRCVARSSGEFLDAGLITEDQKDAIVTEAGESDIGVKVK